MFFLTRTGFERMCEQCGRTIWGTDDEPSEPVLDKSKDKNRQTNEFTRTNKQVNKLGPFHKGRIFALCEGTGAKISVILNSC